MKKILAAIQHYLRPKGYFRRKWRAFRYVLNQFVNTSRWIRHNPLANFHVLDLLNVPHSELQKKFMDFLGTASRNTQADEVNVALVLPSNGQNQISNLFMLFSFLPKAGKLEFFESREQCKQHYASLVKGLYDLNRLHEPVGESLEIFRKPGVHFSPPLSAQSLARSYLKTLGHDRLLYFCDLSDLKDTMMPQSWKDFFSAVSQSSPSILFLVLTPPDMPDVKCNHLNVVFIKELGLSLHEFSAMAWLTDGFIGSYNVLARFAVQRAIPTLLISDSLTCADENLVVVPESARAEQLRNAFENLHSRKSLAEEACFSRHAEGAPNVTL